MNTAFDTNRDVTRFIPWLLEQGFTTAIRYYTAAAAPKRLSRAEAEALVRAGFTLAVVYQDQGNSPDGFSEAAGRLAGRRAHDYAQSVIGQPEGSAIYFAVDFDASATELRDRIVPHFRGVGEALAEAGGGAALYRVGAYGSGLTHETLLGAGVTSLAWLSMSMGHRRSRDFHRSGAWHIHQKLEERNVQTPFGTFAYDPDEIGKPDFGGFTLELPALQSLPGLRFRVIARDGLVLRSGPGREFDKIRTLGEGTMLSILSRTGDWALVDLQGDGRADGHCHSAFLMPA